MLALARRRFTNILFETQKLEKEVDKKFNMLKMYTTQKTFNYEQPQMVYDKETGDVRILQKEKGPKKKIIRGVDEYEREKKALMKEVGLGKLTEPDAYDKAFTPEETDRNVHLLGEVAKRLETEFDIDPEKIYAFSRDNMRIDVGLVI